MIDKSPAKAQKKESKKTLQKSKESIGVNVKKPVFDRECDDVRCPWHGKLSVRGRVFTAKVKSTKAKKTIIVEWDYTKLVPKYQRYERRKSRVTAHKPTCLRVNEGDKVVIAECRPLSKTKSFVMVGFAK